VSEADRLAPERQMLGDRLRWFRHVVVAKVEDLPLADAVGRPTVSELSPLGIIKHLGFAERNWFQVTFAAEDPPLPPHAETFVLGPGDSVESVIAFYRAETARSEAIAAAAPDLDVPSARPHWRVGTISLRWIVLHMIEETARHAGHLDLMREAIDGKKGD
jgi:hypothetical protein